VPARRYRGYSLIELLAVIAVLSVLTMAAYPTYQGYMLKARRTDAKQSLVRVAQQLERCYTRARRYDSPDCRQVRAGHVPTVALTSGDGYYTISSRNPDGFETLGAESFSLYAIPRDGQAADALCASLRIDNNLTRVARSRDDKDTTDRCW